MLKGPGTWRGCMAWLWVYPAAGDAKPLYRQPYSHNQLVWPKHGTLPCYSKPAPSKPLKPATCFKVKNTTKAAWWYVRQMRILAATRAGAALKNVMARMLFLTELWLLPTLRVCRAMTLNTGQQHR